MIICDNCGESGGSRYRLEGGDMLRPGGRDFAELDLCPGCAAAFFGEVFTVAAAYRVGQQVGIHGFKCVTDKIKYMIEESKLNGTLPPESYPPVPARKRRGKA